MSKEIISQIDLDPKNLDKAISVRYAARTTRNLLRSLHSLGIKTNNDASVLIRNPELTTTPKTEDQWKLQMQIIIDKIDIPVVIGAATSADLISDSRGDTSTKNNYLIETKINDEVKLFLRIKPKNEWKLLLSQPVYLNKTGIVYLESMPSGFTSFGFQYDLTQKPEDRFLLESIVNKRVPVEIINGDSLYRSFVFGEETEDGLNVNIKLNLQDPDPENCLRCLEVEIYSQTGQKNLPNTTEVVPESIWQDNENHYCMVGEKDYPLIPVDISKVSKISMEIKYYGKSPQDIRSLLSGLILSKDGSNSWYAAGMIGDGIYSILHKPGWGQDAAFLNFDKISKKRILPKQISAAVKQMEQLKDYFKIA